MKPFKHKKGFTLVELVIVIAVFAILSGAVSSFFIFTSRINQDQTDYVEAQDTVRTVATTVESDIRASTQAADAISGQGTVNDPYIIVQASGADVQYYNQDNVLYRNGAALLNHVNVFSLTLNDFLVTLSIESAFAERTIQYDQKVYLRP